MAKRSGLEAGYDERQVSVLGRAYRYAYLTLLFSLFLYIGSEAVFGRWCDAGAGVGICICISVAVLVVTCIWNDAYNRLNERPWRIMLQSIILGILNLVLSILAMRNGEMVEHGILTFRVCCLALSMISGVIPATYLRRWIMQRKEQKEE